MKAKVLFLILVNLTSFNLFAQNIFEETLALATNGNSEAQYSLAMQYYDGNGVEQNKLEAVKWLIKSAQKGFLKAQIKLAGMYYGGDSIPQNYSKAFYWYHKAALKDDPIGIYMTGVSYNYGNGVKRNYKKAYKWLYKAVSGKQVFVNAMVEVSLMYLSGNGVKKDTVKALYWMKKAAKLNCSEAQFNMGNFYMQGNVVKMNVDSAYNWYYKAAMQKYPPALRMYGLMLINSANDREILDIGVEFLTKAADLGDVDAMVDLGNMYLFDTNIGLDWELAYKLIHEAAERGNINGITHLGYMYAHGMYVQKDIQKAIKYYRIAADKNNEMAQFELGRLYYNLDIPDYEKTYYWFTKAAEQGYVDAVIWLSFLYGDINYAHYNLEKSFDLMKKVADDNIGVAQYRLAVKYLLGVGVETDINQGIAYLEKAVYNNYPKAIIDLGELYSKGLYRPNNEERKFAEFGERIPDSNVKATYTLGLMYLNSNKIKNNEEKAAECFKKAAISNFPYAMFEYGKMLLYGEGIEKDTIQAMSWIKKAADADTSEAMVFMGRAHLSGMFVKQNDAKGYYYIKKAADKEYPPALYILASMYEEGRYVEKDIAKAYKLFFKAANAGNIDAKYHIGKIILYPNNYIEQDVDKGIEFLNQVAEHDYPGVLTDIAYYYMSVKNYEQAFHYYKSSYDKGYIYAAYYLSIMYQNGYYVEKNDETAFLYLQRLAEDEYSPAQLYLAARYYFGRGVKQNIEQSIYWTERALASDSSNYDAQLFYKEFFENKYTYKKYAHNTGLSDSQLKSILFSGVTNRTEQRVPTEIFRAKACKNSNKAYVKINYENDSTFLIFYKTQGVLSMANISATGKSQSYGKISNLEIKTKQENNKKVEIKTFDWHYQNTYDKITGTAFVEMIIIYGKEQIYYKIKIFPEITKLLIYEGYKVK
ncbi:MAG: sel1 repeat family protein [Bacteroidales bacterium]|nr:sel1 repeat family protein [Bacteroidales bacterium]